MNVWSLRGGVGGWGGWPTPFFPSVVQGPGEVGKVHGFADCHGVGVCTNGDGVEMAKVRFDPVLDRAQRR